MSSGYRVVQWTDFKKSYDLALALGVLGFLGAYVATALVWLTPAQQLAPPQLLIRALGSCAFALLTLVLAIGPLARLSPRFLPLLYNRRHMGLTCFLLSALHAVVVLVWYHGFGEINPLVSLLVSNPRYDAIGGFPFESLGLLALLMLFVLAATSHDFWNATLGPRMWKAIHMGIYGAYALLVAHVMLGAVQGGKSPLFAFAVAAGAGLVAALHIIVGRRELRRDADLPAPADGWLPVGPALSIVDGCARIVTPPVGERIAVFRQANEIFAVSNVCRHQGGPLGEGRIVDGCITCPWHGYQYRPQDGHSPAPFTEKIATYRTRIRGGSVYVQAQSAGLGQPVPPSRIDQQEAR
ncbi:ferric reductase-like transmembrane domain-containing protein [Comamonadaceae bacterium G21597-S1]|nr:ferric reductase-like transmembrane domain-containing protein [Comamonadaceae bacterium G21597-S1]